MEAAIDSPEMFEGYTHWSKRTGFIAGKKKAEFDLFISYVKMIDRTMSRNKEQSWNKPHPKWFMFRERVDRATLDSEKRWELTSVFTEVEQKVVSRKE